MVKIKKINAREILDSRGNPTVEVELEMKGGKKVIAAVPSGASTGVHEAVELRDGGKRYGGKGVRRAVRNINTKIAPKLKWVGCTFQRDIDEMMVKLDASDGKRKLGANAILGVSLACARAGAYSKGKELWEYINELWKVLPIPSHQLLRMPRPFFNVINGGKHANNKLAIQEFMIAPRAKSFAESLRMGSEVYHALKKILEKKYGSVGVGDEGGFAPPLRKAEEALDLLKMAIRRAGYTGKVDIAVDCAASDFYVRSKKVYVLHRKFTKEKLMEYYLLLIKKYKLISIEDPFEEEDFESFALLRKKSGIQIVGDDLTATNIERIEGAIKEKSCNCLLLKVNQIGTLSEALLAAKLALTAGWKIMVSHRSGETEDTFIADLAVGIGCGQIKAGAPCRGERTAKYNQLLRIEEELK